MAYSPENPFAPAPRQYSQDNPFAGDAGPKPRRFGLGALRPLTQGATLSWGDEIASGIRALAEGVVPGGPTMGEAYRASMDIEKEGLDKYRSAHPKTALGLELGGGLVSGLAATAATGGLGGAALTPTLTRAIATGAGIGAMEGAGSASGGLGQRTLGAGKGAALGAATTGALGGAAKGVRKLLPIGPRKDLTKLAQAAADDETSLTAIANAGRTSTKPLIAADLGGENLRGLTRALRTQPGPARNEITEMVHERAGGAEERIINDLLETTGLKTRTNVVRTADDIIAERAANAAPLYEAAHSVAVKDDRIRKFLKIPQFKDAYNRFARIAAVEGEDLPPWEKLVEEGGAIPVRALDMLKRGMDDVIDSGLRGGSMGKAEARALRGKLNEMLDVVDENVPEFMQARAYYKGESELLEALETGRTLFKKHPDEIAKVLKDPKLTAGEKDLMRRGMFESLMDRIENIGTGSDIARRVGDKTMDLKRLRLLFEDDAAFDEFRKRLGDEARMHGTKNFLTAGSQTADKLAELADDGDKLEQLMGIAGVAFGSPTAAATVGLRSLSALGRERARAASAKRLQPVLTAKGAGISNALDALKRTAKTEETAREARHLRRLPFAALFASLLAGNRSAPQGRSQ